jgi:hypothetical protein
VVHQEAALAHHLLDISVAKRVAAIPANAEQNDVRRIMAPLEGRGVASHGSIAGRV